MTQNKAKNIQRALASIAIAVIKLHTAWFAGIASRERIKDEPHIDPHRHSLYRHSAGSIVRAGNQRSEAAPAHLLYLHLQEWRVRTIQGALSSRRFGRAERRHSIAK
jgi:hypothetical protein